MSFNKDTGYSEDHRSSSIIQISDAQCKALAALIRKRQDDQDFDGIIEHPLKYWVEMLENLAMGVIIHLNVHTGKRDLMIHGFNL